MNHRRSLITELVLEKLLIVVVFAIIPALANALIITLEPDDYGLGVPLQNEYVTVGSTDGSPYNLPPLTPITASQGSSWDADYKAPTGELTFGNYAFFPPGPLNEWAGMVLGFNQAVSRVSVLANSGYKDQWFNSAAWVAFNQNGDVIGTGAAGVSEGFSDLTFEINIELDHIWKVIMGGAESIPYIYFDNLTFEVPDASVPAPNPIILLMTSLLLWVSCRQLRKAG